MSGCPCTYCALGEETARTPPAWDEIGEDRRVPATPNAMRSVDPRRVGSLECDAWVAYYRRRWPAFLWAAIGLTRTTFALSWRETLRGAWWVLRANQLWAPYPDNDPDACR